VSPSDSLPKVYYPFGGRHFLLNWRTDYDQGHLLVARTEAQIEKMFVHILDEVSVIQAYCEVEIVAPSPLMCRTAALAAHQQLVENFMNAITWRLRGALRAGGSLPAIFALCDTFVDKDDPERPCNLGNTDHYGCANCYEGVRFIGITKEALYELCGERWQHETGNDLADPIDRRLRVSCARQAENDEVLLTAVGDYGPHQQGVYLGDPRFGNEPVLFFFKHIRDLDRDPYIARVEALRREHQKAYESEQQADRKASEIRVALEIEKTINFFTRAGVEAERSPKCPS
jgi:hypothetical protein